MLAPVNWLSEYVTVDENVESLVYELTQIGLEVEETFTPSHGIDDLLVVELITVDDHPNNEDLSVCTISDGGSDRTVVTAASNLNTDSRYVWAPPGARLGDQSIDQQNLDGVPSEGMLCSLQEMGLTGSSSALLQLTPSLDPGSDPVDALGLNDPILEIDLTPNRSDCLSILGIARDYATATGRELTVPQPPSLEETAKNGDTVSIKVQETDRCLKYVGVPVSDVSTSHSQLSVQKRLVQLGLQPRNNIVDATNYVLFEMGNPLHAFDRDRLKPPISVRSARSDEPLTTIDGTKLELEPEDLVIADETGIQALAGVMGGQGSEVSDETCSLLLEGAYFTPEGVRRSSSSHQLSTDSSYRFERGVDPNNIENALARSIEIMDPENAFTVHEPESVVLKESFSTRVDFDPSDFSSLIGYDCETEVIEERLDGLGCTLIDGSDGEWTVETPSWRHDLKRPEDLLEEVVRLDGYESIPSEYPDLSLSETPKPTSDRESVIRDHLTAWGFSEAITFSFLPADRQHFVADASPHRVKNPISEQHATMRQTILDSLRPALVKNLDSGHERVGLFEFGHVFPEDSTEEPLHLGLLWTGELFEESWDDRNRPMDFYDIKGTVLQLLANLGWSECEVVPEHRKGYVKNRSGSVVRDGKSLGTVGQVNPDIVEAKTDLAVWGAELDLTSLGETEPVKYNPFSKQPAVKRDLDLVVDENQYAKELKETIEENARWLEDIKVFDLYQGAPLPEDKKSVSFRLYFRASDKTLNDEEVSEVQEQILDALRENYGAYLRDE